VGVGVAGGNATTVMVKVTVVTEAVTPLGTTSCTCTEVSLVIPEMSIGLVSMVGI
jgi:hypothetical protein